VSTTLNDRSTRLRGGALSRWSLGLLTGVVLVGLDARADAQDTEVDPQVWGALSGIAELGSEGVRPAAWLDVQLRRSDAATTHILRPGLGLAVDSWLSVWTGYAYIPTIRDADDVVIDEHRLWQQLILQQVGPVSLQSRSRFEQRFHEAGDDVGFRLRQLVRIAFQPAAEVPLGIVAWDELFLGLASTDWGARGGFDQNRLFAGVYAPFQAAGRMEAGYVFLYQDRGVDSLVAHILLLNWVATVSI
jgi:hypothetical protein